MSRRNRTARQLALAGRAASLVALLFAALAAASGQEASAPQAAEESVGEEEARERLQRRIENQNQWLKLKWRSRTSIMLKGKRRATVEHAVGYELSGAFARERVTPLGSVGTPGNFKSNFVGGREEEALEWMDRLNDLIDLYFRVSPGQSLEVLADAKVSEAADEASGSRRIEASGYALPDDRVTLFVDAKSDLPRALRAEAKYDGVPFTLQLEMREIEGGVNVPSRAVVLVPGERVRMTVDFFGYEERSLR